MSAQPVRIIDPSFSRRDCRPEVGQRRLSTESDVEDGRNTLSAFELAIF